MKVFVGEIQSNPYTEHDWQKEVTRIALVAKAEGFKEGQQSILSQMKDVDIQKFPYWLIASGHEESTMAYDWDELMELIEQFIQEVKP